MLQSADHVSDYLIALCFLFAAFSMIFTLCELGERITGRFNEIDNEIFYSDWYTFPMNVQKILPIIINGTQSSIVFRGIGSMECTRESFKRVKHSFHLPFV